MTTMVDIQVARKQAFSVSWGMLLFALYVYRSIFSILDELVIMRLTPISDVRNYQNGTFEQGDANAYWANFEISRLEFSESQMSTGITAAIGGFFNSILNENPILINMAFQTIAFIGLAYLVVSIERSLRPWIFAAMFLPSFSVWTTMASKECIVVFGSCILLGYLARSYRGVGRFGLHHILSIVLIYIFKAHYIAALGYALAADWGCQRIRQKALAALLIGLGSLGIIYLLRDTVNRYAFLVQGAFQVGNDGGSSRVDAFFIDQYDVFYRAPEGMLRAFMGSTISEVTLGPLNFVSYVESAVILALIVFFVARRFLYLPIYSAVIGIFTAFFILFPNYPFGVMNAGSAMRYRSGWLIILLFAVFVMLTRNSHPDVRAIKASKQANKSSPT